MERTGGGQSQGVDLPLRSAHHGCRCLPHARVDTSKPQTSEQADLWTHAPPTSSAKRHHQIQDRRSPPPHLRTLSHKNPRRQDAIVKAGLTCTVVHTAQTNKWFEVWSDKCGRAMFIIVLFLPGYRSRFTPALKMEADFILECLANGANVYVFTEGMSASDVRVNLADGAPMMGPLDEWTEFVKTTEPIVLQQEADDAVSSCATTYASIPPAPRRLRSRLTTIIPSLLLRPIPHPQLEAGVEQQVRV